MTEEEWMCSEEPEKMLDSVFEGSRRLLGRTVSCPISDRKLRLWVCATAGAVEGHHDYPDWMKVVHTIEAFSDDIETPFGPPNQASLDKAKKSIDSVYGWLWCGMQKYLDTAISETFRSCRGFQSKWEEPRASEALRDIIDPFCPIKLDRSFITPDILKLAQVAYEGDWDVMTVIADAFEEQGMEEGHMLWHLRGEEGCPRCGGAGVVYKPEYSLNRRKCMYCVEGMRQIKHYKGCHVLDLILGKS